MRVSDTAGFTVIELVVAAGLSLILFTSVAALLVEGLHDQGTIENRTSQLVQAQLAVQRLVRNLREATSVTVTNGNTLTYTMPVATGNESATFTCSAVTSTCTDSVGGVPRAVITGVLNTNIFTPTPTSSPTYIGITMSLTATGATPVTLTDGTGLRNVTLGA